MQVVATSEEPSQPSTILVEDVVEIMGYKVSEKVKLDVLGKVINVEGENCIELQYMRVCICGGAEERGQRVCPPQKCGNG